MKFTRKHIIFSSLIVIIFSSLMIGINYLTPTNNDMKGNLNFFDEATTPNFIEFDLIDYNETTKETTIDAYIKTNELLQDFEIKTDTFANLNVDVNTITVDSSDYTYNLRNNLISLSTLLTENPFEQRTKFFTLTGTFTGGNGDIVELMNGFSYNGGTTGEQSGVTISENTAPTINDSSIRFEVASHDSQTQDITINIYMNTKDTIATNIPFTISNMTFDPNNDLTILSSDYSYSPRTTSIDSGLITSPPFTTETLFATIQGVFNGNNGDTIELDGDFIYNLDGNGDPQYQGVETPATVSWSENNPPTINDSSIRFEISSHDSQTQDISINVYINTKDTIATNIPFVVSNMTFDPNNDLTILSSDYSYSPRTTSIDSGLITSPPFTTETLFATIQGVFNGNNGDTIELDGNFIYNLDGNGNPQYQGIETPATVSWSENNPPTIITPTNNETFTNLVNTNFTTSITATEPDGDTITLTTETLPTGLSLTDNGNGTGTISGTPTVEGTYTFDITAADKDGRTSIEITILITPPGNNNPTITLETPITIKAGQNYSTTITTNDADADPLTLTSNTGSVWITIQTNGESFELQGTPSDSDVGSHTVEFTVNDTNIDVSRTMTIIVEENVTPPTSLAISNIKINNNALTSNTHYTNPLINQITSPQITFYVNQSPINEVLVKLYSGDTTGNFESSPSKVANGNATLNNQQINITNLLEGALYKLIIEASSNDGNAQEIRYFQTEGGIITLPEGEDVDRAYFTRMSQSDTNTDIIGQITFTALSDRDNYYVFSQEYLKEKGAIDTSFNPTSTYTTVLSSVIGQQFYIEKLTQSEATNNPRFKISHDTFSKKDGDNYISGNKDSLALNKYIVITEKDGVYSGGKLVTKPGDVIGQIKNIDGTNYEVADYVLDEFDAVRSFRNATIDANKFPIVVVE